MSAPRRFFAQPDELSVFVFTIDTRNIVSGATNGSQNPLQYKIPIIHNSSNPTTFILKVNDGRDDVTVANINSDIESKSLVSFANPGIYQITIIGRVGFYQQSNASVGYDFRKLISIDNWGDYVRYQNACFDGCTNLIIKATNPLKLPSSSNAFFRSVAGFSEARLDNIIMTDVVQSTSILSGVSTNFLSLFNAFMPKLMNAQGLYGGLQISNVSKVELIGNSVTSTSGLFGVPLRNFTGELILQTPNNTDIQALCYYFNTTPSLGKVDIRSVTNALNFTRNALTTANTDSTLLGWTNNFDWSGVAPVANKVTLDFKNSKYSNNPAVISAKAFLESKGIVFTRLTML